MGLVDVIILAAVAAALAFCGRSIARGMAGGKCSGCGSAGSCPTARSGKGPCPASSDMVRRAEAAASTVDSLSGSRRR
jgi:hypothetical protein